MTSAPLEPEAYDCVAIVTAHYLDRLRRRRRARRRSSSTSGTQPRGTRTRGRFGSCRSGRRPCPRRADRARRLGREPRPQRRRPRRPRLDLRLLRGAPRAASPERFPNALATGSFEEVLADPELEAVVIATPVPTHYALAKQALEAGKHVFVEKPPAMRAGEMEELVDARRGSRQGADARPPAALPPGRAQAEGARRLGRARRGALHLREPAEPRDDPQGRERALVARRSRPLRDPPPDRRGARRRCRRTATPS